MSFGFYQKKFSLFCFNNELPELSEVGKIHTKWMLGISNLIVFFNLSFYP